MHIDGPSRRHKATHGSLEAVAATHATAAIPKNVILFVIYILEEHELDEHNRY